jgi:hypothetical protein
MELTDQAFTGWLDREEALEHLVADDVVERRRLVADDQHDHPVALGREHRHLRVEAVDVSAVVADQVATVGGLQRPVH